MPSSSLQPGEKPKSRCGPLVQSAKHIGQGRLVALGSAAKVALIHGKKRLQPLPGMREQLSKE
jgi:hypothetical protein